MGSVETERVEHANQVAAASAMVNGTGEPAAQP